LDNLTKTYIDYSFPLGADSLPEIRPDAQQAIATADESTPNSSSIITIFDKF
tara:strand:- start:552 stop:707 length:156 start_codon:yes stop_codon:yes gene_type:complete